jgi:hypothetical protein
MMGDFVSFIGSCKKERTLPEKARNYNMEVMQIPDVEN